MHELVDFELIPRCESFRTLITRKWLSIRMRSFVSPHVTDNGESHVAVPARVWLFTRMSPFVRCAGGLGSERLTTMRAAVRLFAGMSKHMLVESPFTGEFRSALGTFESSFLRVRANVTFEGSSFTKALPALVTRMGTVVGMCFSMTTEVGACGELPVT